MQLQEDARPELNLTWAIVEFQRRPKIISSEAPTWTRCCSAMMRGRPSIVSNPLRVSFEGESIAISTHLYVPIHTYLPPKAPKRKFVYPSRAKDRIYIGVIGLRKPDQTSTAQERNPKVRFILLMYLLAYPVGARGYNVNYTYLLIRRPPLVGRGRLRSFGAPVDLSALEFVLQLGSI